MANENLQLLSNVSEYIADSIKKNPSIPYVWGQQVLDQDTLLKEKDKTIGSLENTIANYNSEKTKELRSQKQKKIWVVLALIAQVLFALLAYTLPIASNGWLACGLVLFSLGGISIGLTMEAWEKKGFVLLSLAISGLITFVGLRCITLQEIAAKGMQVLNSKAGLKQISKDTLNTNHPDTSAKNILDTVPK